MSEFVSARHKVKTKLLDHLHTASKMGQQIVQVIGQEGLETINKKYKNHVVNPYKVKFADAKLDVLLKELPGILLRLQIDNLLL